MSTHPPIDSLARFATGLLPPNETVTVALHVARCPSCQAAATRPDPGLGPGPAGEPTSPYAAAIRRVAERSGRRAARHERASRRAPGLLDQLLALPTEDWDRAIRSSPRFHSYAFARRVLAASKAGWTEDPARSQRLAELALEVTNRLSQVEHGQRDLNDLRSKAWAYVGNCRRIRGEYPVVPDALAHATESLNNGSGEVRNRVELLRFTSSLLVNTERFDAAVELCELSEDQARRLSDRRLLAQSLMVRAKAFSFQGHPEESVRVLERAIALLADRPRRDWLEFGLTLNAARTCVTAGYCEKGLAMFRSIDPRRTWKLGRLAFARYVWGGGLVYSLAGEFDTGLKLLERARQEYLEAELAIHGAWVTLDLAETALRSSRPDEAFSYACQVFPVIALSGAQTDTLKALDLFRRAGGLD